MIVFFFFQLHGNGSRAAFSGLVRQRRVIYVLNASEDGKLLNEVPEDCHLADWILVDSATGGRYLEYVNYAILLHGETS